MQIKILVTIDVEKTQGKFASKDDVTDQLIDAIDDANPGELTLDSSSYEVQEWSVEVQS